MEQLTAQQVYDHVLNHLRKQKTASRSSDGPCKYRGPNGTSCAVGCLLTDDEVGKGENSLDELEVGTGIFSVDRAGRLPERLKPHLQLLERLQNTHDHYMPSASDTGEPPLDLWERIMEKVAKQFNLAYTSSQTGVQNG